MARGMKCYFMTSWLGVNGVCADPLTEGRHKMTRQHATGRWTTTGFLVLLLTTAGDAAPSTDRDLERAVEDRLASEEVVGFNVEVSVREAAVTLDGEVPTLWHKEWAVARAVDTDGVDSVVSHVTIRDSESPTELAQAVADTIRRYPYYTVFDDVSGSIRQSVVTLRGVVTPRPDKPTDLRERVARVPGVKGVVTDLTVLSPSIGDERIRVALARRLYGHSSLNRYLGYAPGIHIIVENGYVTLKGTVLTQAEKIQADSIARRTVGVIKVDNQLHTKAEARQGMPQSGAVVIND